MYHLSFFEKKKNLFLAQYIESYVTRRKKLTKLIFVWLLFPIVLEKTESHSAGAGKSPFISPNKSIDNLIHPVMSMNPVPWHKSLWDNNDQPLTIMNKGQGLTFI